MGYLLHYITAEEMSVSPVLQSIWTCKYGCQTGTVTSSIGLWVLCPEGMNRHEDWRIVFMVSIWIVQGRQEYHDNFAG